MTAYRPNPQPGNTNDALRQNIEDHIACTQALVQTLAQEHEALLGNEPAALEQVSARKNQSVSELQQLAQKLSAIPGARAGAELERSIRQGGDAVQRRWQALMGLAAQCQQANLANGALLEAKQSQIKWALGHMLGTAPVARTYGPAGISGDIGGRRILARA